MIDPAWEKDLVGYLWGKATALECIPHAIGGMPDHLHVVLSIPPRLTVATIIGQLIGASSHHINEQYLEIYSRGKANTAFLVFPNPSWKKWSVTSINKNNITPNTG